MILTKRQWVVFLFIFVSYLMLGAFVFYTIESKEEAKRVLLEELEKEKIDELITDNYPAEKQEELFGKISHYCNKPMGTFAPEVQTELTWSYYHSIFFVLTVVSTIGFGSLSPTTPFTRVFMIIYGIIGIPINGIVIITLGEYFGTTFTKIYRRWKTKDHIRVYTTLGLIVRIIAYLLPGLILLILIPSTIIVLYEGWTFDRAIEFTFGTLTTIGTGQYIPGTMQKEKDDFAYILYKAFLLIWIVVGLGYLAMFFNFLTKGFQHKKMFALEHKLTKNIKKTNKKIRKELRFLMNEYLFSETCTKPIYRERRVNALANTNRTQSCPDLLQCYEVVVCKKKRAISELPPVSSTLNNKVRSDSDLENIDKIKTFQQNINHQHNELLIKVVNALANYNDLGKDYSTTSASGETNAGFESDEYDSSWMLERNPLDVRETDGKKQKPVEIMNTTSDKFNGYKSDFKCKQAEVECKRYVKTRRKTLPSLQDPGGSLFTKFKKRIRKSITGDKPNIENYTFRQSMDTIQERPLVGDDANVNDNSLSDFLRALSIINFNDVPKQQTEDCNYSTSTSKVRRMPIIPSLRRISLDSVVSSNEPKRRYSESCSSTINYKEEKRSQFKLFSTQRRISIGVLGALQKLKRSNSKQKDSVTIDIEP